MKLAFTTDYYPPHMGGGVEAVVSEVAGRLAGDGHRVMVVTLGRKDWPRTEVRNGVLINRFPSVRLNRVTGLELTISLAAHTRMKRTLEDFEPDVVNAHHQYFTTTPPALSAARALGIPTVLTLHIAGLDAFTGWRGTASRIYDHSLGRRLVAKADALVTVSEAVAKTTVPRSGQPLHVIPNGVDLSRFQPAKDREPGSRVVFVGRLIANKGPHVAIDAFKIVKERSPDATLTLVGDGPMAAGLRRRADELGLEGSVSFVGMREDVAEILRRADIFVRPSQVEGMPLTVLEAMATGLPVVVCDVGGVREVVADGVTGFVVAPGSVPDIAASILALLADREQAAAMGVAALERVRDGYSWDAVADANLQVFEELIGHG